jgi:hypothetical protein
MVKLIRNIPLTLALLLTLFSCDRIKRKGDQVVDKTKEKIIEKKNAAIDKVTDKLFTNYSQDKPDTKANRKIFADFFNFQVTPDVHNLYAYADELGIDASYYLAFNCDDSTIKKIKQNLSLETDKTETSFGGGLNSSPIFWWDTAFINKSKPFSKQEKNLYWYLWYDKLKKRAYFFTFDT